MILRNLISPVTAMWLLSAAATVTAQPVGAPTKPDANVLIMKPLTLVKIRDMNFGDLAVTTAGQATIDPITDRLTSTGGVTALGGTVHSARFAGATSSSAVVNIKVPRTTVYITRQGGTERIALTNFTLDGQSKRTMAQAGQFEFNVGATAIISACQAEGVYLGTFDVTIQYP